MADNFPAIVRSVRMVLDANGGLTMRCDRPDKMARELRRAIPECEVRVVRKKVSKQWPVGRNEGELAITRRAPS